MSKPKTEYRVGVGASSILMILVVLALTALSLLSFSGARHAEVMAKRNVDMVTAYYAATAEAQEKLAVLDSMLATLAAEPEPTPVPTPIPTPVPTAAPVVETAGAVAETSLQEAPAATQAPVVVAPVATEEPAAMIIPVEVPEIPLADRLAALGLTGILVEDGPDGATFSFSVDAGYSRTLEVSGTLDVRGIPRYQVVRHELVSQPMKDSESQYQVLQPDPES